MRKFLLNHITLISFLFFLNCYLISSLSFSLINLKEWFFGVFFGSTLTRDYFLVLILLEANFSVTILLKLVSQWSARITKSSGLFSETIDSLQFLILLATAFSSKSSSNSVTLSYPDLCSALMILSGFFSGSSLDSLNINILQSSDLLSFYFPPLAISL